MKHLKKFNGRVRNERAFKFTPDERDLIEDLLLEYADKYDMKIMPLDNIQYNDDQGERRFDFGLPNIQYLVQRLANISIDIVSITPLCDVYKDIKDNFIKRLKRYGYHIHYCSLSQKNKIYDPVTFTQVSVDRIEIVITQKR